MGLITKLSGLLKAITYTIRVSCWAYFKTVLVAEIVMFNQYLKVPVSDTDLSPIKKLSKL